MPKRKKALECGRLDHGNGLNQEIRLPRPVRLGGALIVKLWSI